MTSQLLINFLSELLVLNCWINAQVLKCFSRNRWFMWKKMNSAAQFNGKTKNLATQCKIPQTAENCGP